jgi:hypothetical protein
MLQSRNNLFITEARERWPAPVEGPLPGWEQGLHQFFLAAARDRDAARSLALAKYRVLGGSETGPRSVLIGHLNVCMTERLPLPIKEDMHTLYGMLQPSDDRGRCDILQ